MIYLISGHWTSTCQLLVDLNKPSLLHLLSASENFADDMVRGENQWSKESRIQK